MLTSTNAVRWTLLPLLISLSKQISMQTAFTHYERDSLINGESSRLHQFRFRFRFASHRRPSCMRRVSFAIIYLFVWSISFVKTSGENVSKEEEGEIFIFLRRTESES